MKDMTIRELADLCEVAESTIRSWITSANSAEIFAKTAEAQKTSKAARFTLPEVLAIVRAGGKNTLAALLEENAAKSLPAAKPRLPNGKQTEYLYRLYHEKAISPYQVQLVLGVAAPRERPLPEVPVSLEQADSLFRELGSIAKNGRPQLELTEGAAR